ncbi:hypothetical protein MPER_11460 [Moniliophthora perniciosa FA553]|nr:hypothetical protein MPER_11460 [Moniliophthora perniciosa FA553]
MFKLLVQGVLALYKGATPPGSSEQRNGITESNPKTGLPRLTIMAHGLAGMCAGVTSTIVATPVENLKMRTQGVLGLWSGFTGSVAFRANFFWMFSSVEVLMRGFSQLEGTPYEPGGLGSLVFRIYGLSPAWIIPKNQNGWGNLKTN